MLSQNYIMKNIVTLPPEYWAALSLGADRFGYFSRQEMVSEILKTWVNQYPELIEKGKELAMLKGKIREVVARDTSKLLVDIPNLTGLEKENKYRFWYRDEEQGYKDSFGPYPRDAYMKFVGRELTQVEFDEIFTRYEVLS